MNQPVNNFLLTYPLDLQSYLGMMEDVRRIKYVIHQHPLFMHQFPLVKLAECPFCRKTIEVKMDLMSLKEWRSEKGSVAFWGTSTWYKRKSLRTAMPHANLCQHFFVSDTFVNFNDLRPQVSPEELPQKREWGPEVPYVMGELLDKYAGCRAVMTTLPICRIEDGKFVPRYTAYILVYFIQPDIEIDILRDIDKHFDEAPHGHLISPSEGRNDLNGNSYERWWDLAVYAKEEKLFWLEPDNPQLPFRSIKDGPFPFTNIKGRKYPIHVHIPPLR